MSGQGGYSRAFTMDLDFRAMILYGFLGGKSDHECFSSWTILIYVLGDSFLQNTLTFSVWTTDGGRRQPLWSPGNRR